MSITGQKVPFVGTGLVVLTLKFQQFPRQRHGIGFGSLADGVGRVALPLTKKILLPAVKSTGKEFLSQRIPELLDEASTKKTPKQTVRSAVRRPVKKELGGSERNRRGK